MNEMLLMPPFKGAAIEELGKEGQRDEMKEGSRNKRKNKAELVHELAPQS